MKNAHIAFIGYPLHPQIGSTLPIVSVLVRRGYRITYATSDIFAPRVAAVGAEIVPLPRVPAPAVPGSDYTNIATEHAVSALEAITRLYDADRPALIIYDFVAFAGRILANQLKIPAIQTSPTIRVDRDKYSNQLNDPEFRAAVLQYSKNVDRFFDHLGVRGCEYIFHREKLNMYLIPRAFQPCLDSADERCFYAGRCAGEQPYYGNWEMQETGGRPIALVSSSTHYVRGADYFRMCMEVLDGLGWHVILSIGNLDPGSLGPLPPHVEIVQNISHVKILPRVSVFLCLGGMITSAEAAYHGVPLVVTSHGFLELEFQADNLARLGVAIHIRKHEMNRGSIRQAVIYAYQDATMRNRVKELQHVVRREPGGEEAVNRIEQHLDSYR